MRREDMSDLGLETLENNVEVTQEGVEGVEGPEAKNRHKA